MDGKEENKIIFFLKGVGDRGIFKCDLFVVVICYYIIIGFFDEMKIVKLLELIC